MYELLYEKRDLKVKAKKIRKNGMIPCNILDGKKKETLHIQVMDGDARKLLREKGKGGVISLKSNDGDSYHVIIKDISVMSLNNEIENITFQLLNEDEYVNSFARIILKNKDMAQTMINQVITEIPYRSLPQDLVEEVQIDLSVMKSGTGLALKNLPIWNNDKLSFGLKEDTVIVYIT